MKQATAIQVRFGKVEEGSMGFVGISFGSATSCEIL